MPLSYERPSHAQIEAVKSGFSGANPAYDMEQAKLLGVNPNEYYFLQRNNEFAEFKSKLYDVARTDPDKKDRADVLQSIGYQYDADANTASGPGGGRFLVKDAKNPEQAWNMARGLHLNAEQYAFLQKQYSEANSHRKVQYSDIGAFIESEYSKYVKGNHVTPEFAVAIGRQMQPVKLDNNASPITPADDSTITQASTAAKTAPAVNVDYSLSSKDNLGGNPELMKQMEAAMKTAREPISDKLYSEYPDVQKAASASEKTIRIWQHVLHDAGNKELVVDGKMGEQTRKITQRFLSQQAGYEGPVDGKPLNTVAQTAMKVALDNLFSPVTTPTAVASSTLILPESMPVGVAAVVPTTNLPPELAAILKQKGAAATPPLPPETGRTNRTALRSGDNLTTSVPDDMTFGKDERHKIVVPGSDGAKAERWTNAAGAKITVVEKDEIGLDGKKHHIRDASVVAKDGTTYTRHDDNGKEQRAMVQARNGDILSNVERSADGKQLAEKVKQANGDPKILAQNIHKNMPKPF